MGADFFADKDGEFQAEFTSYDNPGGWNARPIAVVHIKGLKPFERIDWEINKGTTREEGPGKA